jgi:hypothetical protein
MDSIVSGIAMSDGGDKWWGLMKIIIPIVLVLLIITLNSIFGWSSKLTNRMFSTPTREYNDVMRSKIMSEVSMIVDKLENSRQDYSTQPAYRSLADDERMLVNFHVLGCRLTGYFADKTEYGIFSETDATRMALRIGMRVLVLDVDYLDREPTVPVLVCRNDRGQLVSANVGKIRAVTEEIARYMRSGYTSKDPVIVVLNVMRLPAGDDGVMSLKFMENIARGLQPLSKLIMRQTASGSYMSQAMESRLFLQPIKEFENRVIVLTNVNTTAFRKPPTTYKVDPTANLDNLVHGRIYNNATPVEPPTVPAIYANTPNFYTELPSDSITQKKYRDLITKCWSAALPKSHVPALPSGETMGMMLGLGVQCIIVDMIDIVRKHDSHPIFKDYFRTHSYIVKKDMLRYKEEKPIVVNPPAKSMNAGGGVIGLV